MWLIDFVGVTRDYFVENYRNILVTALGFIFIVSIFTVTLTSEQGMKSDYISSQLESDIEINFITQQYRVDSVDFVSINESIISGILERARKNNIDDLIDYDNLTSINSYCELINETSGALIEDLQISHIHGLVFDLLNTSSRFSGRFPINSSEVVMIRGGGFEYYNESTIIAGLNYQLNETITLTKRDYKLDIFNNQTVKIVGIYDTSFVTEHEEWHFDTYITDELIANNPVIIPGSFITADLESYLDIIKELNIGKSNVEVSCQFTMSLANITDPSKFEGSILKINRFMRDISWMANYNLHRYKKLPSTNKYFLSHFRRIDKFERISQELSNSAVTGLLLMLPALSITIYFSSFTSNVFFDRRRNQIGLLRIRGISRKQLLGILVIEGFLSAMISLVVGYGLGVSLAALTIRSKQFLNYQLALDAITISSGIFKTVLFWTIIFAGMIIVSRIISLSRLDVMEARNPVEKKPFWRRFYIDIFLLVLGLAGNAFFFYMMFNPVVMMELGPLIFILIILTFLLLPFPFFLLFGGIMTLSRLVAPVVTSVAHYFWRRFTNLFSYSMTTMIRQKESATRTILLISLIISMIWATFTLPPVLLTNNRRTTYYSVGADCYYSHEWNTTVEETMFTGDGNITGFTPVGLTTIHSISNTLDAIIIFPKFLEVAFYEKSFGSTSAIEELFLDNHSILMNKRGMEDINRKIGDNVTLRSTDLISLSIIGSFTYWPRLVTEFYPDYWDSYDDPKIALSNETLAELYNAGAINLQQTITEGYYFKLSPDANFTALKEIYGQDLRIAVEDMQEARSTLWWGLLWLHLNALFLVNICTIVMTIVLYGYKQVRGRAQELSVERSLGMKQVQIGKLFFYESITLLGFSYLFGSLLGMLFSTSIVSILIMSTATYAIPPPVIFFPLETIHFFIVLLIIAGVVASIIPAILARRQDITKSLKVN